MFYDPEPQGNIHAWHYREGCGLTLYCKCGAIWYLGEPKPTDDCKGGKK